MYMHCSPTRRSDRIEGIVAVDGVVVAGVGCNGQMARKDVSSETAVVKLGPASNPNAL